MTYIDSQGAAEVAELLSDIPFATIATVGADSAVTRASNSMWVSINGSPAGYWDGPSGRVSSAPSRAESTLTGARRSGSANDTVDLGSAL